MVVATQTATAPNIELVATKSSLHTGHPRYSGFMSRRHHLPRTRQPGPNSTWAAKTASELTETVTNGEQPKDLTTNGNPKATPKTGLTESDDPAGEPNLPPGPIDPDARPKPKEEEEPVVSIFSRTFDCRYPTNPLEFPVLSDPIPIPNSLPDLVAWIDAFVHKTGELVIQEQRNTQNLQRQIIEMKYLKDSAEKSKDDAEQRAVYWQGRYEEAIKGRPDLEKLCRDLATAQKEASEYKVERDQLQQEVNGLKTEKETLKGEKKKAEENLEEANNGIAKLDVKINELNGTILQLNKDIEDLEMEYGKLMTECIVSEGKIERAMQLLGEPLETTDPNPNEDPDLAAPQPEELRSERRLIGE